MPKKAAINRRVPPSIENPACTSHVVLQSHVSYEMRLQGHTFVESKVVKCFCQIGCGKVSVSL